MAKSVITNPCDATCPKCGTTDINLKFIPKGKKSPWYNNLSDAFKDFYDSPKEGYSHAKTEHIQMHCRTCQYKFVMFPLERDINA